MVDYLAGLGSDHLVGVQMTFLVMKLGLRGKHVAVLDVIDKELEEHLYYTLENHGSLLVNTLETKRVHKSLIYPVDPVAQMIGTCQVFQVAAMMEVLPLIPVFGFFVVKEDASMTL